MKQSVPAQPTAPGAILKRELEARGWSQKDFAEILGRPPQAITEIIRGSKQITPDTALELSAALGTPARLWTSLETEYRLHLARAKRPIESSIKRRARLFQKVPISELVRRRWIDGSQDVVELESQVCKFLGIETIEEEPRLVVSYRRSSDAEDAASAQCAWVRRMVVATSKRRVKGKFSVEKLRKAIPQLRELAREPADVAKVPAFLESFGLRFIIIPHLPRTKLDGAAAFGPDGPIVALSLRYDRIDWFWFTLMHEVSHFALGHKRGHLDFLEGGGSGGKDEDEANKLAAETLVQHVAVERFVRSHHTLTNALIEEFAEEHGVHPGIVVGRLQFLGAVPYSHFRGYLSRVSPYLESWMDHS